MLEGLEMKLRLIILLLLIIYSKISYADCGVFGCVFQPGTHCVGDVCVSDTPIVTPPSNTTIPSTNEIRLESKPAASIQATVIDCSKLDLKTVKVILTRRIPAPSCKFYSSIFFFSEDINKNQVVDYFFAQKDLLNRYVFLYHSPNTISQHQYDGPDFIFNIWENHAYDDFFKNKTCQELISSNAFFQYGISIEGDGSDYEGATFYFR